MMLNDVYFMETLLLCSFVAHHGASPDSRGRGETAEPVDHGGSTCFNQYPCSQIVVNDDWKMVGDVMLADSC